jgi:putative FmdB family regulatory protein
VIFSVGAAAGAAFKTKDTVMETLLVTLFWVCPVFLFSSALVARIEYLPAMDYKKIKKPGVRVSMPIYEFYCSACNTIYNFFSKSVNTGKIPLCPTCKDMPLTRQMSVFAAITGGGAREEASEDFLGGVDEGKMEKALMQLAAEAETLREDDPRAAAQLMRKLSDATGMKLGDGFEEALHRLEKGEDPDRIDEELGGLLSEEDPFAAKKKGARSTGRRPRRDETLYDL